MSEDWDYLKHYAATSSQGTNELLSLETDYPSTTHLAHYYLLTMVLDPSIQALCRQMHLDTNELVLERFGSANNLYCVPKTYVHHFRNHRDNHNILHLPVHLCLQIFFLPIFPSSPFCAPLWFGHIIL